MKGIKKKFELALSSKGFINHRNEFFKELREEHYPGLKMFCRTYLSGNSDQRIAALRFLQKLRYKEIFAVLALLVVLGAMLMGGESIFIFLDIPSLLIAGLISIFLLLTKYSPTEIILAFTISFKKEGTDKKGLIKSINLFDSLGKYLILSAILGAIIGFISMAAVYARDTQNPGSGDWAEGSAIAIITIFYSLIFYMTVAVPFKNGLKNRLIEME